MASSQGHHSRKMAAILHADVAGSTGLVQLDEAVAHERINEAFSRFSQSIDQYGGTVHEIRGDALVAEFSRVSDAACAALDFQKSHAQQLAQLDDDIAPTIRVGISLGEVIFADGMVTGAGVVLAQRVEQLAEPGGVCITGAVHETLPQYMPFDQYDLGEQEVKGFNEPVRVYRVGLREGAALPEPLVKSQARKVPVAQWVTVMAAVILICGGGLLAWIQPWEPEFEPASVEKMAFPLPDKPSLAVLPFDNYSDEEKLDFFADGLTENITSALSKAPGLFVIARNSAATYKGKPVNVKQLAEDLGVQYVLEGSVQKSGEQLRITTQLVDALKGHHLWTDRFDRQAGDVFAVQDEITKRVFTALQVELTEGEHARMAAGGTDNLEAWLLRIEAYSELIKWTRESQIRARELYQAAHEADPNWAFPLAGIAFTHEYEAKRGWSASLDESIRLGIEAAERAIELQPDEPIGYMALGNLMFRIGEPEKGIEFRRKAVDLAPNSFATVGGLAMRLMDLDMERDAIELFERVVRLSPKHPWWINFGHGLALHLVGRKEEAIDIYQQGIDAGAKSAPLRARLAAVYADLGRMDEAKAAMDDALRLNPKFTAAEYQKSYPFPSAERNTWYEDLLLRSGLPEHPTAALPDKPSIAVLPFTNMSDDSQQEYFVDGMTEDLITDLSKISGLFVIARNSSFVYKGRQAKLRQVAEELGVRYVLEGSVRRIGDQVRINTQLIDATTGGHVWAERYDRKLDNIFAVQDDIMERVVQALELHLTDAEQEQRDKGPKTTDLEAYDLVLKARKLMTRFDHKAATEARNLLQRAIEIDPAYAEAHSLLGFYYFDEWRVWGRQRDQNLSHALELATTAVELSPSDPAPHVLLALVYQWRREFDAANAAADTALALQPNDAITLSNLGSMLYWAGRSEEALGVLQQAIRLDPFHPPNYLERLAAAYSGVGEYDQCVEVAKRGIALDPNYVGLHVDLAACYAALGRQEDAQAAAAEILRTNPRFTLQAFASYVPFSDELDLQRKVKMLRQAGVPDSADEVFRTPEGHMTGDEIRAAISGQAFVDTRPARFAGTIMTFDSSGTLNGHPQIGSPVEKFGRDQGKWWIEGDKFCRKWNYFASGRTECFSFVPDGDSIKWINRYGEFHSEMKKLD